MKKTSKGFLLAFLVSPLLFVCSGIADSSSLQAQAPAAIDSTASMGRPIPDDPDSLAYWFPHQDTINHSYICIANALWNDTVNIYDVDQLLAWHTRNEKLLADAFTAENPASALSANEKADSMISVLANFLPLDSQLTTAGMLTAASVNSAFSTYRLAAETQTLLRHSPEMRTEVMAWSKFHQSFFLFCRDAAELTYWMGTMSSLAATAHYGGIIDERVKYLRTINASYIGNAQPQSQNAIDKHPLRTFEKEVNRTMNELKAYSDDDVFGALYKERYSEMQANKKSTIKNLKEWLTTTEHISTTESLSTTEHFASADKQAAHAIAYQQLMRSLTSFFKVE